MESCPVCTHLQEAIDKIEDSFLDTINCLYPERTVTEREFELVISRLTMTLRSHVSWTHKSCRVEDSSA